MHGHGTSLLSMYTPLLFLACIKNDDEEFCFLKNNLVLHKLIVNFNFQVTRFMIVANIFTWTRKMWHRELFYWELASSKESSWPVSLTTLIMELPLERKDKSLHNHLAQCSTILNFRILTFHDFLTNQIGFWRKNQ